MTQFVLQARFMCLYLKQHNSYPGNDWEKIPEAASNLLAVHGHPRQQAQTFVDHWNADWKHASNICNKKTKPQHQQVLPPIQAYQEHKKNPIAQLEKQLEEHEAIGQAIRDEINRLKRQAELDQEAEEAYERTTAMYKSQRFYDTPQWKRLRMKVLSERGAICECCGASAATGASIAVDHIKARLYYPELALEESNLQVLCKDCNIGKGSHNNRDWRRNKAPNADAAPVRLFEDDQAEKKPEGPPTVDPRK